jgi:hypothetical protein
MDQDTGDESTIARANERLHAARRALSTAYDRRDALADEYDAAEDWGEVQGQGRPKKVQGETLFESERKPTLAEIA